MEIQLENKKLQKEIKLKNERIKELETENEELKNELTNTLEKLLSRTDELIELQKTIELSINLQKLCSRVGNPLFLENDKLINSAINILKETDTFLKE